MLRAALKHHLCHFKFLLLESCTTYNAACGIETMFRQYAEKLGVVALHKMLRAALKPYIARNFSLVGFVAPHKMLRAALKLLPANPTFLPARSCTT